MSYSNTHTHTHSFTRIYPHDKMLNKIHSEYINDSASDDNRDNIGMIATLLRETVAKQSKKTKKN